MAPGADLGARPETPPTTILAPWRLCYFEALKSIGGIVVTRGPKLFSLEDVSKLKGKHDDSVIVYLDKGQWSNLTQDLKPVLSGAPPVDVLTLSLTTLPGVDGGFVELRCPVGDPITGAEGQLRCGKTPFVDFPDDDTDRPRPRFCILTIRQDGSASCGGSCGESKKTCRLSSYSVRTTVPGLTLLVLACSCQVARSRRRPSAQG